MATKKGVIPKVRKNLPPVPTGMGRSTKTLRSPPQKQNQKQNDSMYPCGKCEVTDEEDKVLCDRCLLWYHFTCANVTSEVEKLEQWLCDSCASKNQTLIPSGGVVGSVHDLVNLDDPNIVVENIPAKENAQLPPNADQSTLKQRSLEQKTTKSNTSRKSGSVASSTSRKATLALQRLEEERQLREQREKEDRERRDKSDKEYLDQKYSILDDLEEEDSDWGDDNEDYNKLELVKQWADYVQFNNNQPPLEISDQRSDNKILSNSEPRMCSTTVCEPDDRGQSHPNNSTLKVANTPVGMLPTSTLRMTTPSYWNTNPGTTSIQLPSTIIPSSEANIQQSSMNAQSGPAAPNIQSSFVSTMQPASDIGQISTSQSYLKPFQTLWDRALRKQPLTETTQSNMGHSLDIGMLSSNSMVFPPNQMTITTTMPLNVLSNQTNTVMSTRTGQSSWTNNQVCQNQPLQANYQAFTSHNQTSLTNNHGQSLPINNQPFIPQGQYQLTQLSSQTTMPQNLSAPLTGSNQTFVVNSQPVSNQPVPIYSSMSSGQTNAAPNNYYGGLGNNAANMSMSGVHEQRGHLTREQIAARQVIDRKLPIFYGNPEEWDLWYNRYISTTTKCNFDNSENLDRLEKCLKGRARSIVESRLSHSESVPWIMTTLQMIFGRPETVLKSKIKKVRDFPQIKADNLESLINFAFEVQSISTTIESLGCQSQYTNPMLLDDLTDKLPPQEKKDWAKFKRGIPNVTIKTLANWLYELAGDLSTVVEPTFVKYDKKQQKEQQQKKQQKEQDKEQHKTSSSKSYINTQVESTSMKDDSTTEKIKQCPSCKKESCTKLVHCKKFKDASRSDKWSIVKTNKLCSRCLGGHTFYRCRSDQVCKVEGCKSNHHTLLHNNDKPKINPLEKGEKIVPKSSINAVKPSSNDDKSSSSHDTQHCNSQRSNTVRRTDIFRIIPVVVYHRNKPFRDYAYLDDGSNMTTMTESLAKEIGLDGTPAAICVDWAFGQTHSTEDSTIVSVGISGFFDNAPRFKLNNVRTVKDLHLPSQSITTRWLDQFPHLKNVPISTYESVKPRILIGLQYSRLLVSLETIEGKENEPIACKTRLGWVVQGPSYDNQSTQRTYGMNMCEGHSNDDSLHQLVKEYFASENCGVKVSDKILESKEARRAREILESTSIKKDGRYETGLLWKRDDVELPDSYNMAFKRLRCLEMKLEKNHKLKENLHNQIKEFLGKKYIRKLSSNELKQNFDRVWYLPTFPVFNPKKPDKVRIVWDAAAKVKNTSLNSMLLTGPDQLVPLVAVLRRFRERAVAITGDIKEMYHQVRIRESDRNVQRFLWRDDPSTQPDVYTMDVMTFGSTCSPSSAQFIKDKNAMEFENKFPRAVKAILENHYVDDMIDCTHTVDEAAQLVKEVKEIHQHN